MTALFILAILLLCCGWVLLFPENPRESRKPKKIYYSRDYQGRFAAASRSKKITYVGGSHKYVTNI